MVPQLSIQQQQEGFIQNFSVLRMLGGDAHLRHLREGQLLPYLRPFGQKIFELLFNRRRTRRNRRIQYHLRAALHQEFPVLRRRDQVSGHQLFGKFFGIVFQIAPALHESFIRNLLLDARNLFLTHFAHEQVHHDGAGVGIHPDFLHLLLDLRQLR